ncbi:MAG TPA: extracellular solute-binding protein [Gemmatimonadales bacterium]|nr:extracellular solute-binding protein [Gemmatimonadales bacterium]
MSTDARTLRSRAMRTQLHARALMAVAFLCACASVRLSAQSLTVYTAGSLARPFRELLDSFRVAQPGVVPAQVNAGSVELARRIVDLGQVPDVYATADIDVIPRMLVPHATDWYLAFARNEMVLLHARSSTGADSIDAANWWRLVTAPGVRVGSSDPALDPSGYRTLLVFELAERHYHVPGLAARLRSALRRRYIRPSETDLIALVETGELDYAWSYRSLAVAAGLPYVALPPEIDLGSPADSALYAAASVRVGLRAGTDSMEVRGSPILYGLTIPRSAPHPARARAFVRFVLSPAGRAILARSGLTPLKHPRAYGRVPGNPPMFQ